MRHEEPPSLLGWLIAILLVGLLIGFAYALKDEENAHDRISIRRTP